MNCKRCNTETKKDLCKVCKPFGASTSKVTEQIPTDAISLGADPELLFVNGTRVISATQFVPDSVHAELGVDGNSTVAELRPKPAKHVYELAETCKKLLTQAAARIRKTPNVKMMAGHGIHPYPIGGHVHFGIRPTTPLLNALDLGSFYLMAYDDTPTARARRSHYGYLGAMEPKPYGFEYRTPQSWLSHPDLMKETIALYHSIALEYKVNPEGFKQWIKTYEQIKLSLSEEEPTSQIPEWIHSPSEVLNAHWKYNHKRVFKKFAPNVIKLITDLTAMRTNWNGYRPLLHQLLSKAWHKNKYDPMVDLKAWNITLKEHPKKVPLLVFRETDRHLDELGPKVNGQFTQESGLVVFGLKKSRDVMIGTHPAMPPAICGAINSLAEKFGWKTGIVENVPFGMGIHKTLRANHQEELVEFLNVLQERLKELPALQKLLSTESNAAFRKSRCNPRNALDLPFGNNSDANDLITRFERQLTGSYQTMDGDDDSDNEDLEPDYTNDEEGN